MPAPLQVKLLRVLSRSAKSGRYSNRDIDIDVRIISPRRTAIRRRRWQRGEFREDLQLPAECCEPENSGAGGAYRGYSAAG